MTGRTLWRVTARDLAGSPLAVARRVEDRRDAERLADRWMLRGDVNSVAVERESDPAIMPRPRRTYR